MMNAVLQWRLFREGRIRAGTEPLPVDAGNKPGELRRGEVPAVVAVAGPAEAALVQASRQQPDAVAVPHHHFETGAVFAGEQEGVALLRWAARRQGGLAREGLDAGAHVGGLRDQPEVSDVQHRLSSRMRMASAWGEPVMLARFSSRVAVLPVDASGAVAGVMTAGRSAAGVGCAKWAQSPPKVLMLMPCWRAYCTLFMPLWSHC